MPDVIETAVYPHVEVLPSRAPAGCRPVSAVTLTFSYPAEDVPLVQLVLEFQEAVDREFDGSWNRRRYVWHRNRF